MFQIDIPLAPVQTIENLRKSKKSSLADQTVECVKCVISAHRSGSHKQQFYACLEGSVSI